MRDNRRLGIELDYVEVVTHPLVRELLAVGPALITNELEEDKTEHDVQII